MLAMLVVQDVFLRLILLWQCLRRFPVVLFVSILYLGTILFCLHRTHHKRFFVKMYASWFFWKIASRAKKPSFDCKTNILFCFDDDVSKLIEQLTSGPTCLRVDRLHGSKNIVQQSSNIMIGRFWQWSNHVVDSSREFNSIYHFMVYFRQFDPWRIWSGM